MSTASAHLTAASLRDDPATRWAALRDASATGPAEQARIKVAAELAEATLHTTTLTATATPDAGADAANMGRDGVNADLGRAVWAQVALMWHQVLTDTDAFTRARISPATGCRFDAARTRAWLTQTTDGLSVADTLRLGDDFDIYGFDKWVRITDLVAAAQAADLFGVTDHTVGVLHLAGEHGFVDRHRITLATPQHGVLCSADLDTADLMTEHLCGVDAAVHLLDQAAQHTDTLLQQRALLADVAWPTPAIDLTAQAAHQPLVAKAFRPLAVNTHTPNQPPAPRASGVPRRRREPR